MENKIFNTRIKNKRDTEANWTSKNPVLLNGEIIVVDMASGETRFKVGDGAKKYSQLPFQDAATLGNYVPTTRKINSKALSSDIRLTASDVGALPSTTTALKNPKALTFTGAVTGSYDGSASKTVAIPSVDMELDSTSFNPVSNSAVVAGLDEKLDTAGGIVAGISFVDGVIILPENEPTVSTAAITKGYVDTGLSGKLDKSGGTLTGNLTGKYITGTWLQTTEATDLGRTPGKIAVLDDSGWVYHRTPAELLADLGTDTVDQILKLVYPVGSIYMSINNVSPATLFGGKWVQIKGRFLLGASDVYKANTTGGEEEHTLTVDEMPTHAHYMATGNAGGDGTWTPNVGSWLVNSVTDDKHTWWGQIGMDEAGGSAAHNNMPPYLVVYMWRRLS